MLPERAQLKETAAGAPEANMVLARPSPPNETKATPFLSRLRVRLLALVLLAILPALGLVLYTAFDQRRTAKKEAEASAQRVARLASTAQKQHIETSRHLLITLSQLREIRSMESAGDCQRLLQDLRQVHSIYANIGVIDRRGYLFASALDVTNGVYLGDRSYFQLARDSGKFAIGDYQVGRLTERPTLNMAYPLKEPESGLFRGVVFAALDLDWLNQLAARADFRGSTLTVIDRHGTILVRYAMPDNEENWIGKSLTNRPDVTGFLNRGAEVTAEGVGLDGVRRLYTATALSRSGGLIDAHVIVGIPVQVAYASANRTLTLNLIFLGIVATLALGAAWMGGDFFILRHVQGLVTAARRMSQGDLTARSGAEHGPGEIGQLARSFDEMAFALEQRVGDLQRAEAELKALNEELEQRVLERTIELKRSNEDLEQFAYVASHDLQEPLRMINNYIQLLRQRYGEKLDSNAAEFMGFALDGAKRMQQLIDDLLTYSRVGTQGKEFAPTSCNEALDRALANLAVALQESGAAISRDALPKVKGDLVQLTQLFQNLVGNAIKFRRDAPLQIHVGAVRNGEDWELTVHDNGIGIAEQDFARIFVSSSACTAAKPIPAQASGSPSARRSWNGTVAGFGSSPNRARARPSISLCP
jgi:signal transduction histidine kinase/type II secretory pathway pseudopilin PulG